MAKAQPPISNRPAQVGVKIVSGDDYYDEYIFPLITAGKEKYNFVACFLPFIWFSSKGLWKQYFLCFLPFAVYAICRNVTTFEISILCLGLLLLLIHLYLGLMANGVFYRHCKRSEPHSFLRKTFSTLMGACFYFLISSFVFIPNSILEKSAEKVGIMTSEQQEKLNFYTNLQSADLNFPTGIVSVEKKIFVVDSGNNVIKKINLITGEVSLLAGAAGLSGANDGVGASARFNSPTGVATDNKYLYVADTKNHIIRTIEIKSGEVKTLAGTGGQRGSLDGTGAEARFGFPSGIVKVGDVLYVSDSGNNTIRKINIASTEVETVAGKAKTRGFLDGAASEARFDFPTGLTSDGKNLFVADTDNHCLRRVDLTTSVVTTYAGRCNEFGDTDGYRESALFNLPLGIALEKGNLYFSDIGNHTVSKIELNSGKVLTLFGVAGVDGYIDGEGAKAHFNFPSALLLFNKFLFLSDSKNNALRKLNLVTLKAESFAGGSSK